MWRVRPDRPAGLDGHRVRVWDGRPDRPLGRAVAVVLVGEGVVMDDTLVAGGPDCCLEILVSRVGQVHYDPVGPPGVAGHRPDVGTDRGHALGDTVPARVGGEILDRDGVDIGRDDGRPAGGHRHRERSDAGEHIEHPLAGLDLFDDPVALGRQPRAEIHLGKIDGESVAVLAVDRLRALAGEYLPVTDPASAFHLRGAVEDRPGGDIRLEQRRREGVSAVGVVLVNQNHLADALVGGVEREQVGGRGLALAPRG